MTVKELIKILAVFEPTDEVYLKTGGVVKKVYKVSDSLLDCSFDDGKTVVASNEQKLGVVFSAKDKE